MFINPLTDFGFKRVFASEENKDILIAFLNDCIIPPVYSFNILDYNAPEFMGREECFWAVHLKDNQNRIFSKKIILFFMELTKFAAQFFQSRYRPADWNPWVTTSLVAVSGRFMSPTNI
ncbi:MAG: PD-(D/E)XK nuclease family transposase [Bacteroidales bacterium]|nr:PD-(D/E)XK nuclease family transposase [Bacteroidales bacterium]